MRIIHIYYTECLNLTEEKWTLYMYICIYIYTYIYIYIYVCMYVYIKKLLFNEVMKLKVYSETQTLG